MDANTKFDNAKEEARQIANVYLPEEASCLVRKSEQQRDADKIDQITGKQILSELICHKGVSTIKLSMPIELRSKLQSASNKHAISQQELIRRGIELYIASLDKSDTNLAIVA